MLFDYENHAEEYDDLLRENPIDLQILNLGEDGNIGFIDENTDFDLYSNIIKLSPKKRRKMKNTTFILFEKTPIYAITQGIKNILQSKEIILIAMGKDKAEGINNLMNGAFTTELPITALITYTGKLTIYSDEEAGSLIKELYKKYPETNLIAEDLGDLRPEVLELRDRLNLPGMFISEFTIFDLKNLSTNKQIVYPGTHDNETLWGWFNNLNDEQKEFIKKRLKVVDDKKLYDEIVKYIFTIPSLMTIFPLQDLLKLDNSARMNSPGTVGSPNWEWKLKDHSWEKKIKYPNPKWFK